MQKRYKRARADGSTKLGKSQECCVYDVMGVQDNQRDGDLFAETASINRV